jgi:ribonucleoside-triphosphate reductase (thioredoxin)
MLKRHSSEFQLSSKFIESYTQEKPPFGFNGLGELVYSRTYSRLNEETGLKENWHETVKRVEHYISV